MHQSTGKWIVIAGVILVVLGMLWYFYGDKFSLLGRLPGDIRIEKENFSFYFPITTMILISVLLNLFLRVYKYLTR